MQIQAQFKKSLKKHKLCLYDFSSKKRQHQVMYVYCLYDLSCIMYLIQNKMKFKSPKFHGDALKLFSKNKNKNKNKMEVEEEQEEDTNRKINVYHQTRDNHLIEVVVAKEQDMDETINTVCHAIGKAVFETQVVFMDETNSKAIDNNNWSSYCENDILCFVGYH